MLSDTEIEHLNLELVLNKENFVQLMTQLPDISNLNLDIITIDKDMFLTTLLNNISNEIISAQSEIRKLNICEKKRLCEKLTALKDDYNKNLDEILGTERLISNIIESEINEKLQHNDKFYNLRFEKKQLTV